MNVYEVIKIKVNCQGALQPHKLSEWVDNVARSNTKAKKNPFLGFGLREKNAFE